MSVQRFKATTFGPWPADDDGGWVRYSDHVAALAEAFEQGKAVGHIGHAYCAKPRVLTADETCPTCGRAGDA